MLSLFVTATIEGWPSYAFIFVDSNIIDGEINSGPIKDNNTIILLFFMIFILIGSMFLLSLFTGVI